MGFLAGWLYDDASCTCRTSFNSIWRFRWFF